MKSALENTTQPEEEGIASLGFWADKNIPVSTGARHMHLRRGPAAASAPGSAGLEEVHSLCMEAKLRADVGDDIRWGVILEEAAKMSCGLRGVTPMKAKQALGKDDDTESTSASGGSGADTDVTESGDTSASGSEEDSVDLSQKRPRNHIDSSSGDGNCTAAVRTRVYSVAVLLQCWTLMQHTASANSGSVDTLPNETEVSLTPEPIVPHHGMSSPHGKSPSTAVRDAPWRRSRKERSEDVRNEPHELSSTGLSAPDQVFR